MNAERWQEVNKIVDTALDLEPGQRKLYVEERCSGDRLLKMKVTELLQSIEAAQQTGFLENTEAYPRHLASDLLEEEATESASLIGQQIGRYHILGLVGHGGMGSVYVAERADDAYDQQVALKILRRGMDTPENIARFKRERNILASLDHPNIARLLDGGVIDNGLPYLVMEYVKGVPLLEYCNSHQLSIKERLALFQSVCEAVKHAHRNATIHRDLKPSNIIVGEDGVVKVLDFGIAKLIKENTAEATFQTQTGARILTPGYAAPEQFENKAITTATDSYTLGTLLYELLAGIHPFDSEQKNLAELEQTVRNESPAKPSEKFKSLPESQKTEIASQRNTRPPALIQELTGDLDAIVMKALRKEPEARYASVNKMLEDFRRYKDARPLAAKRDTYRYRVGKFIKRNRKAVISGILILAAIIGFGSYHINRITKQRNIAKTEAQKAETVKNFLITIFRSSNPYSSKFEGRELTARQLLINGKNAISGDLQRQPDVYTEVLMAIGDALKSVDAYKEAEKSYKKALAKSPVTTQPLRNKAKIYVKLGWIHTDWRRSQKKAHQYALNALKVLRKIENPSPTQKASVFGLLGRVISVRDHYKKGNSYFEKADSIYVHAGLEKSYEYIQMLTAYGRSLIYVSDYEKAIQTLLKSNRLHREKFGKPTLTISENYKYLGWAYRNIGNFIQSNTYLRKAIELNKELSGEKTVTTAMPMYHLARNYALSGNFEKSEELARKVLGIYRKHLEPTNNYIKLAKNYVAIASYNQGKFEEGERLLQDIRDYKIRKFGKDQVPYAHTAEHIAILYKKTGRFQKAITYIKEAIQINTEELGSRSRAVAVNLLKLADIYRKMGDYKRAEKQLRQAKSILDKAVPDTHFRMPELYLKMGKLKRDTGKAREAKKYFQKAYNLYIELFGEDSNRAQTAKSLLQNIAPA